jgi:hypothetical protein
LARWPRRCRGTEEEKVMPRIPLSNSVTPSRYRPSQPLARDAAVVPAMKVAMEVKWERSSVGCPTPRTTATRPVA